MKDQYKNTKWVKIKEKDIYMEFGMRYQLNRLMMKKNHMFNKILTHHKSVEIQFMPPYDVYIVYSNLLPPLNSMFPKKILVTPPFPKTRKRKVV